MSCATAFVPSTGHRALVSSPRSSSSSFATKRVSPAHPHSAPRYAASRARVRVRMAASPGNDGEDVEETVSLKDLKKRLQESQQQAAAEASAGAAGTATTAVPTPTDPEEDARTEREKEIERLRAAEKFIEVDEGKFECTACGYVYEPEKGDPRNGYAAGTAFEALPDAYTCPSCRTPKRRFVSRKKVIAGFAENQTYGFGSNTMTGGEKSLLIFGGLLVCALLLLSGYALN